jgi:hypothetical protein
MDDVNSALQKRDIEDLQKTMESGFRGVHKRQDTTNGNVIKNRAEIEELKKWRSFIMGGLAVLTLLFVPILIFIITNGM